jgi:NhaP-type Na+/H+ or K+/H+ antiporter
MGKVARLLTALTLLTAVLTACGARPPATTPATSLLAGEELAPVDPARVAEEFHRDGSPAEIDLKITGTGGLRLAHAERP